MFWTALEIPFHINNNIRVAESTQYHINLKTIPQKFADSYQKLSSISKVPVILPNLPNIYAKVLSSKIESYFIILGFSKSCSGGNTCRFGSISGEKITLSTPTLSQLKKRGETRINKLFYPPDTSQYLVLSNGIKAIYLPFSCGGVGCTDGSIVWESDGFQYTVGLKAANLKSATSFANEFIKNME
jgi:hypothetical protein